MNIAFLVDENLLGLLRKLRMMGVDSIALKETSDKEIYFAAASQKRIILTKDQKFYRTIPSGEAYLVQSEKPQEQLIEILKTFSDLGNIPLSRCFECNTIIAKIPKESLKDRVDPNTFRFYQNFFECPTCHRVYWEGSHFKKLREEVRLILQIL
ncbi:Mut7-C RNAse domain-containing protein [Bdellovibrio svalbardensis]|uniref:Mut7-C RNAse domain-containing protein n=1 Tax=Bdellovibrio svalbardensis TaxID=2972972 RepID=A0ABT6DI07_9BACT|nr:Mut7-C RNAse domain-containing protein [Bdellovibrio svalbardensis]MDG0815554.1 Mut7-C RNAse domain-containing protein [Bdellovibrio svalbardensis]